MNLTIHKIGWYLFPGLIFIIIGFFLVILFWYIYSRFSDDNFKRVLIGLFFALSCVFIALVVSLYRQDAKLTIQPQIAQIRHTQKKVQKEKQQDQESKSALEDAISVANDEKIAISDPQTNPSAIITRDWIAQKRKLIELISDEDVRNDYKSRFDDIESYFLPEN